MIKNLAVFVMEVLIYLLNLLDEYLMIANNWCV